MNKVKIHESFDNDEVTHLIKKICAFAKLKPENFQVEIERFPSRVYAGFMINKHIIYLVDESVHADVLKAYVTGYIEAWQGCSGMQWEASMNSDGD